MLLESLNNWTLAVTSHLNIIANFTPSAVNLILVSHEHLARANITSHDSSWKYFCHNKKKIAPSPTVTVSNISSNSDGLFKVSNLPLLFQLSDLRFILYISELLLSENFIFFFPEYPI